MRLLSIVLLLSILSCKDEHRRKPYCGEAPHYNITAELELERQNFSFKTILYDSKLDKKRIDQLALNTLFDVGISRVDNQDFIPLKERVEDLLNKTFNKLTYIVFYYKLDLSDKVTKIGYENIKAISIYNYQERSKRYAHSLYKKEGKEFKIDADFSSLVSKLRFNDLGNIITNEIFPNEINKGYLLVKNQMEAKKHYQERKEHNNLSHNFSNQSYRDREPRPERCQLPCPFAVGTCYEDLVIVECRSSNSCLAEDVIAINPDLEINLPLYYAIKNEVLEGTKKGEQYISDYYYISNITYSLNLIPLITILSQELPIINQKLAYIYNSKKHGQKVVVDSSFKAVLSIICSSLEGMSKDSDFKSKISSFRSEIALLEGKTVDELRMLLKV